MSTAPEGTPPTSPLPAPLDAAVRGGAPLIVFGGTFDPPHLGHVSLPLAARDAVLPAAWLLYVPAARSPLKPAPGASDTQRLEMLRLALHEVPRAGVWSDELDRASWLAARAPHAPPEPSYSVDTLRRLRTLLGPSADVRLLIGTDQAVQFQRWRGWREILTLARPLVMLRAPITTREALSDAMARAGWSPGDREALVASAANVPLHPASSTAIRAGVAANAATLAHLHPRVADYIARAGLYR